MKKLYLKRVGSTSIYAPSLQVGVSYYICIWEKRKTNTNPIHAEFLGIGMTLDTLTDNIPVLSRCPSGQKLFFRENGRIIELEIDARAVWIPYQISYKNKTRITRKRVTFRYDPDDEESIIKPHLSKEELHKVKMIQKKKDRYAKKYDKDKLVVDKFIKDNPFMYDVNKQYTLQSQFKEYFYDKGLVENIPEEMIDGLLNTVSNTLDYLHSYSNNGCHDGKTCSEYTMTKYDELIKKLKKLSNSQKFILDEMYAEDDHKKAYDKSILRNEAGRKIITPKDMNVSLKDIDVTYNYSPIKLESKFIKAAIFIEYINRVEGAMQYYDVWKEIKNSDENHMNFSIDLNDDGYKKLKTNLTELDNFIGSNY